MTDSTSHDAGKNGSRGHGHLTLYIVGAIVLAIIISIVGPLVFGDRFRPIVAVFDVGAQIGVAFVDKALDHAQKDRPLIILGGETGAPQDFALPAPSQQRRRDQAKQLAPGLSSLGGRHVFVGDHAYPILTPLVEFAAPSAGGIGGQR